MPTFNKQVLEVEAGKYGFRRDTFEKVVRLKRILEFMNSDEVLSNHLWLKGGTAINLTIFDFPRLSVDIDMDYTPNDEKAVMEETRQEIDRLLRDYMESEGYVLSDESRFMHSLDSYHYNYINAAGNKDMIKIELNYSLRAHILAPVMVNMIPRIFEEGFSVRTLDPMEIFATKANALLNRAAARDAEKKAVPYMILANQFVSTAFFEGKDKYEEIYRINKAMTEWIGRNMDKLRIS